MKVRSGFSLIELMVYILIVGILGGAMTYGFVKYIQRAKISKTKIILTDFRQAISLYNGDTNEYPEALEDLVEKPGNDLRGWDGPYTDKDPIDGFGNPLVYNRTRGQKNPYELYSYGKNGPEGDSEGYISVWDLQKK